MASSHSTIALGKLGRELAARALEKNKFTIVCNWNEQREKPPFAHLIAERDGSRYFIHVVARNERTATGEINKTYNLIGHNTKEIRQLRKQGVARDDITRRLLKEVRASASEHDAKPAWVTIPTRPEEKTYAAYFGLLDILGLRRSVPMTVKARERYEMLSDWQQDKRI